MILWRTLGILTIVCFVESSEPELVHWPAGSYGIPQAASGCPYANDFQWLIGRRYQDTEDTASNNYRSTEFHLDGEVDRTGIARSFCVKTDTSTDNERSSWPPGKYCIYKKGGSCPVNLSSGFIKWDDEDWDNANNKTGTLPDGVYDHNTKIEFCCRTDGDKNDPITLPILKPFFLLAYDSAECQQVKWATVNVEWIRFDNENRGNLDEQRGSYPHGAGIRNHMIHYCYYQGCNETLTGVTGTFNSPNYPRKYPDGQHCSWRITVSPAHQIHLIFTDFKLQQDNNTDSVNVYDGENASREVLGVFYGGHPPPEEGIYSSSNHILVVFKSDKKDAHTGFYASYNAVKCSTCKSTRIMEASPSPSLRTNVPSKLTATFTADTSSFLVPEISSAATGRLATSEWPIMISKSSLSERRTKKLNRAIFNSRIKNMALSPTSLQTEPIVTSRYPLQAKIVSSVADLASTANEKSKPAVSSGAMITTVKGTISSPNLYLAISSSSTIKPLFKKDSLNKATPSLSTSRSRVKAHSSTSHLPEKTSSPDRELETTTTSYYKETELSSSYTGQTSAGTRHSKPPPALLFHETSATSATMNITSSPNVMEVTSSRITYLTTLNAPLTTSSSSYETVTFSAENIYVTSRSQVVKIAASSPTLSSSSPSPSSSSPSPLLLPSLPSSPSAVSSPSSSSSSSLSQSKSSLPPPPPPASWSSSLLSLSSPSPLPAIPSSSSSSSSSSPLPPPPPSSLSSTSLLSPSSSSPPTPSSSSLTRSPSSSPASSSLLSLSSSPSLLSPTSSPLPSSSLSSPSPLPSPLLSSSSSSSPTLLLPIPLPSSSSSSSSSSLLTMSLPSPSPPPAPSSSSLPLPPSSSSSSLSSPSPSSPAPLLPTTVSLPSPSPPSSSLSSSSSSSSSSLSSSLSSPPVSLPPTPSSRITTPFVASSNSSIREMVLPSSMPSYRRKEMKSAYKEMISITTEQTKPTIINLGTAETTETTETEPEMTSPFTELTPTPTIQVEALGAAKEKKGLNLIVILVPLLLVLLLVLLVLAALCYCKRKKAKEGM